jgi:hypothetical protein
MELEINKPHHTLSWPQLIKNCFDFEKGEGLVQLDLNHLFSSKDSMEIYKNFNSNLNWIIRDGKRIEIPDCQVSTAKYMERAVDFFRCLLQQNMPEKDHVHLNLETLRVARSDGTQHQVGGRWHQDHEAYFSLAINLTENSDPNSSTKLYHLEPGEKYQWDDIGNAIPRKHWRETFIKPFHLCILNSGVRYFLFPYDRCRPIIHRAPQPVINSRRLAVFATFSISGIEQGMDLKDIYIPCLNAPMSGGEDSLNLKNLRNHWREILGIDKSVQTKTSCRVSKTKFGIYNMKSINFTMFNKLSKKQQENYSRYRIANFGLRQFENFKTKNNKLLENAIPIGELSRTLCFFSEIGSFSVKKIMRTNDSPLIAADSSLLGNNNYDLFVQFRQPKKAFQLLSVEEVLNQIDQIVLILYREAKNYIYPLSQCESYSQSLPFERERIIGSLKLNQKNPYQNEPAQIFTSFPLSELHDIKNSFFLSYSIETAWKRGARILVNQEDNKCAGFTKKKLSKLFTKTKCSKKYLRNIDEVPFFLPRTGVNRTLQSVNLGSQLIALSRKISSKNNSLDIDRGKYF